MEKIILRSIIGLFLVTGVLAATYYVVDLNQQAVSGAESQKSSGLYMH